jgi:hypothetical protein
MRFVFVGSVALVALLGVGVCAAATVPPIPDASVAVDKTGTAGSGEARGAGAKSVTIKKGWNTIHAYNCLVTLSGDTAKITLYGTPDEDVSITSPFALHQIMMSTQCATGNWISFYVTKLLSGGKFNWSSLQSWDYK